MTLRDDVAVEQVLRSLQSVAHAVLTPQGQVVRANAGFSLVVCNGQGGAQDAAAMLEHDASACFVSPSIATLTALPGADGALLYQGLLNMVDATGTMRSLIGTVHRRGDNIELIAEHNTQEHERLIDSVLSLNDELTQTQRELARANRAQATLLDKLEAAQNQLLQKEKLASIGQLAAGVAHEINNPIGFVSSNVTVLGEYLADLLAVLDAYASAETLIARDPQALAAIHRVRQERDLDFVREDSQKLLAESRDGLLRVKQIVQNLKDFSRVDQAEWQLADLHQGLNSTLNVVASELLSKAEVVRAYGDLPPLLCNPGQLNQVFMNLLVNAAQAIETQGTITLRTGRQSAADGEGDWGWVEVQDSGAGIAPEHLSRIFEPFFTTKPVGSGTGLGLSLSYGIVNKHGGRIEVASERGKGTCFRIWLPLDGKQNGASITPDEPER